MMRLRVRQMILFSFVILSLISCVRSPHQGSVVDTIESTLQHSIDVNRKVDHARRDAHLIDDALVPKIGMHLPRAKAPRERRFDIAVKNATARTFFMGLVEGTRYSMVVSPEVKGKVTLSLKNVTIDEALQTVQDVYGYAYRKTSIGFEILANHLQTRIFAVNYLFIKRHGKSQTEVNSGQITQTISANGAASNARNVRQNTSETPRSGSSVQTVSDVNFWEDLHKSLDVMVSNENGRSVVVNPEAGLVVIRAYPTELEQVARYLDSIQTHMERQVILEAKILEVRLSNEYQAGINWDVIAGDLKINFNPLDFDFPRTGITTEGFADAFVGTVETSNGNFKAVVQALETQGNVQILSSPRVSTLNNQQAVIKVGQDEFFVTGVASTVSGTTSDQLTEDIQLTPFFSGITLDVTPQIDQEGSVILHVHPSVTRVEDQEKKITINNSETTLPLAFSRIRESDSVVHAHNKQVVIIGGLIDKRMTESIAQAPFLGQIPFIGSAFRLTKQNMVNVELVILLRPIVVDHTSLEHELSNVRQAFERANRGFHFGGRPDLYGNLGESRTHSP